MILEQKEVNNFLLPSSQAFQRLFLAAFSMVAFGLSISFDRSLAQVSGEHKNPEELELYETVPGQGKQETILDATNPMELMNRLRAATALDNATSPSDAIDDALKAFEEEGRMAPLPKWEA